MTPAQRVAAHFLKGPGKPKKNDPAEFDPHAFLGRWLLSKKGMISNAAMEFWAKKYPYSGRAFRIGSEPYTKPRGSWCRTLDGLINWKCTMHPLCQTPHGFFNYRGHISRGIDLAAMVKGEHLEAEFGQTIMKVDEVTPLATVTDIVRID